MLAVEEELKVEVVRVDDPISVDEIEEEFNRLHREGGWEACSALPFIGRVNTVW